MSLPPARQLAAAARERQWAVYALDETPGATVRGPRTFYGGTDKASAYAQRYDLCLVEPPLDLITRVPPDLLAREVRYGTLAELHGAAELGGAAGRVFVKPADPIDKSFDAGVYADASCVRGRRPLAPGTRLLVSQVADWTSEFRCFIREGRVEAWSPYLSFGRPTWKPGSAGELPASLDAFCRRLVSRMAETLPPAYVVDVGVLEDGRWAVVEFNPAWCSGILGADAGGVLRVVQRAAMHAPDARPRDLRWVRLGPRAPDPGRT